MLVPDVLGVRGAEVVVVPVAAGIECWCGSGGRLVVVVVVS